MWLSKNPAAIQLLEANQDKICWSTLSTNPAAINLLQKHPDKICWSWLCKNPAALNLLSKNQDKIEWGILSYNPGIYEYDYTQMTRPFKEELLAVIYHPENVKKLI
jgi:hypothetical protein